MLTWKWRATQSCYCIYSGVNTSINCTTWPPELSSKPQRAKDRNWMLELLPKPVRYCGWNKNQTTRLGQSKSSCDYFNILATTRPLTSTFINSGPSGWHCCRSSAKRVLVNDTAWRYLFEQKIELVNQDSACLRHCNIWFVYEIISDLRWTESAN